MRLNPTYDRVFVKMVRDKTRKSLVFADACFISGAEVGLEIHHMYTLSSLVNEYLQKKGIVITDENKLQVRQDFIEAYSEEIKEQTVLTKAWHKKLHAVFGYKYPNYIVPKVRRWILLQRDKLNG